MSNIITSAGRTAFAATASSASSGSTGSLATAAVPGGKMDKDAFLRLLTTQMRYQDPLDPMDGKQMAADLAQFSGLEQLLNINEKLDAQAGQFAGLAQAMGNASAMSAIGKQVVVESDKVLLSKDAKGVLGGTVLADITTSGVATLTLLDRSGREVGSRSLGYIGTGTQRSFDIGSAAAGLTAEGAYQVRIDVAGADGKDVPQKTYTVGKVDGLAFGPDGAALLTMGPLQIAYSAIVKILA
ncbi:MAG TPA: flagellar hook capping FlgD N-terminal domain-containing protein [Gemmatimonadaceae bacterium]|nr:flagellar hook capping FlgD N-terminal domain-containing protein [Gemmatimonadaceae bacterium]